VVYPLANLLDTDQVRFGDLVSIDWDGQHEQLFFARKKEGALVHAVSPGIEAGACVADAVDGMGQDAPAEAMVGKQEAPVALQAATRTTGLQLRKNR